MNLLCLYINKIRFETRQFASSIELYGDIKDHTCWLVDSLILNAEESSSLVEMNKSIEGCLLYRATRDGFAAEDFHYRCDGRANTITIIKNNLDYVFGGYASASWNSSSRHIYDPKAFLFSLRRDGKSCKEKFSIKKPEAALYSFLCFGPSFGGGNDLLVCDQSNIKAESYAGLGHSFNLPAGYSYSGNTNGLITGKHKDWTTTEIEVYQINFH